MNEVNETWAPVFLFLVAIALIFVYHWVLEGIAYQAMARRRGLRHRWLVWLPVGRDWVQGSLSDQYQYTWSGDGYKASGRSCWVFPWGCWCCGRGSLEYTSGLYRSSCNTQATSSFGKSLAFPL